MTIASLHAAGAVLDGWQDRDLLLFGPLRGGEPPKMNCEEHQCFWLLLGADAGEENEHVLCYCH